VPQDFIHPRPEDPVAGAMSYEFQVQSASSLAKELAPAPALALGPLLSVPPAPAPANETYVIEVDATKEEVFASQGILLQIFMLATAFIVGHILRRKRFYYLHEASAALLIGELAARSPFAGIAPPKYFGREHDVIPRHTASW